MSILEELLAESSGADPAPAREVRVGPFWTGVWGKGCGLASTIPPSDHSHGSVFVREAGRLGERPVDDLCRLALSDSTLEAGIGIAAINSVLRIDPRHCVELNAAAYLAEAGRDRTVVLVGHFPFVPALRETASRLDVIELKPGPGDVGPAEGTRLIPRADVLAVTGCALINHTLDDLLSLRKPGCHVVLLGPSAPLSPVLFRHGIDVVCGTRVVDPPRTLESICQGATFPQVAGVQLLTMRKGT